MTTWCCWYSESSAAGSTTMVPGPTMVRGGHAFVIGDNVKGGLYGEYPSLDEDKLNEGDLQFNNDFRGMYASLLEKWMGLDSKPIVNGAFEQMDFI